MFKGPIDRACSVLQEAFGVPPVVVEEGYTWRNRLYPHTMAHSDAGPVEIAVLSAPDSQMSIAYLESCSTDANYLIEIIASAKLPAILPILQRAFETIRVEGGRVDDLQQA